MSYRICEIDRTVREAYYSKSMAAVIRNEFMPNVDLDEAQLELFAQYVTALEGIGVNLQDERLQDTLNAYPDNMEAAFKQYWNTPRFCSILAETFSIDIMRLTA